MAGQLEVRSHKLADQVRKNLTLFFLRHMAAIPDNYKPGIRDLTVQRPAALDGYHPVIFAPDDKRRPANKVRILFEAPGMPVS